MRKFYLDRRRTCMEMLCNISEHVRAAATWLRTRAHRLLNSRRLSSRLLSPPHRVRVRVRLRLRLRLRLKRLPGMEADADYGVSKAHRSRDALVACHY